MSNLGRFIRNANQDYCGECSGKLQLRARITPVLVKGEELSEEVKYLYCPNCECEFPYTDKKSKRGKHREAMVIKEVKEVKNGGYKKRPTAKGSFNRDNKRSY